MALLLFYAGSGFAAFAIILNLIGINIILLKIF